MGRLDTTQDAVKPGVFIEWEAPKTRLVVYPCADNKVLNMCAFVPTSQAGEQGEGMLSKKELSLTDISTGWEATGNKTALINAFADFCPAVREFAERAGEDLKVWQLYDMESLPRWAQGRAVLIGDSAHPFQPCTLLLHLEAPAADQ
jgi:salicylate hydroxylase